VTRSEADIISELATKAADVARDGFLGVLEHFSARTESPIEKVFLAVFLHHRDCRVHEIGIVNDSCPRTIRNGDRVAWDGCLASEVPIGPYRCDFVLQMFANPDWPPWLTVDIECDGHNFHEKTKKQAKHDKERDRWMQINNIVVLRFTGSEIWNDPIACASQLFDLIEARDELNAA
jgi:very-short-patch-repair endonuclease